MGTPKLYHKALKASVPVLVGTTGITMGNLQSWLSEYTLRQSKNFASLCTRLMPLKKRARRREISDLHSHCIENPKTSLEDYIANLNRINDIMHRLILEDDENFQVEGVGQLHSLEKVSEADRRWLLQLLDELEETSQT